MGNARRKSIVVVENVGSCNATLVGSATSTRARLKIAVICIRTEILDKLSLREHSAEGRISFDITSSGEPHVAPDAWLPTLVVSPDLTHAKLFYLI